MIDKIKDALWKQFGASIDMLKNAITAWPGEYWETDKEFFYNAYHCLVFLDYYLTVPPDNYSAALPYTITLQNDIPAEAVDDVIPNKIYSKEELLNYLQSSREKCRHLIAGLTEEKIQQQWITKPDEMAAGCTMHYNVFEIILYNMKHVQHHVAQLNLILRQKINNAPDYISEAEDEL